MITVEAYNNLLKTKKFTPLIDLANGDRAVNIIGIVAQSDSEKAPAKAGRDWSKKIEFRDPSIGTGCTTIMMFLSKQDDLARCEKGDILLLYRADIKEHAGNIQIHPKRGGFAVFSKDTLEPKQEYRIGQDIVKDAKEIVAQLSSCMAKEKDQPIYLRKTGRSLVETVDIKDHHSKYFNYIGQVVQFTPYHITNSGEEQAEIVLTDYTTNPHPPSHDDNSLQIPNNYLINCTLWDNHAKLCPDLEVGQYIYINNCNINAIRSHLQFSVRGDQDNKTNVRILDKSDPVLQNLLQRQGSPLKRKRDDFEDCPLTNTVSFLNATCVSLAALQDAQIGKPYLVTGKVYQCISPNPEEWITGFCNPCKKRFRSSDEKCPQCRGNAVSVYQFLVRIKDEQGTCVELVAVDTGNNGLFGGVSASKAKLGGEPLEKFVKIASILCDPSGDHSFDFGLVPYLTPSGKKMFQIRKTKFSIKN